MITAETITRDQLRAIRDTACECRPYPPLTSELNGFVAPEDHGHAAVHDCDIDVYEAAVRSLAFRDPESLTICLTLINNPSPPYARALRAIR